MALFGSLRSCYCLLYLGLLLDPSLADDDAAANTVIEQDPVGACMWPTPESAVMSCDSGSLVIIRETYMTRLVGRADKCSLLHSVSKPEYASCRLPLPANFAQQLSDKCNNTQQCTLGSFITGATVVTGSTTCGNGSDMALERNFLVIKWGCIGYTPTTVAFDDANSTDIIFADSSVGDPSTSKAVWIVPLCVCLGVLLIGGLLTGLLIWRRDLIKQKARELRRLRREQRRQAKLQLAAASGGQLPPPDAPDGGSAEARPRGADVASWIERAPSYSAVAGVSGTLKSAVDRSQTSTPASPDAPPPTYMHASAVVIDEKRTEHRRHKHRRRGDGEVLVPSSSSADGATTSSRRHHRSSDGRSRSHDRGASGDGGRKSHSGGGRRSRSRQDGTLSEISDVDLERRRRRREQLYKGAAHQIRKPDELSPSTESPSAEGDRHPEATEATGGSSEAEQTAAVVPVAALARRSST